MTMLHVNRDRLWQSLMEMAEIGATPAGGVGRLPATDEDKIARDLFVTWLKEANCDVTIDGVGNIFGSRAGSDASRAPVLAGSHLDSQPLGGKFDGAYGVLAALEVIRTLNDAGLSTQAAFEAVNWTDEEGCRFTQGVLGSSVFSGHLDLETALADQDPDGLMLGHELARIGYIGDAPVGGRKIAAYFEAHIEQGPILEQEKKPVGIVVGAQARRCYIVTVSGTQGHAGTVPMVRRKDASHATAKMIDAVIGTAYRQDPVPVVTVGAIHVTPNARNTIPRKLIFSIDSRSPDDNILIAAGNEMKEACNTIAKEMGVELDFSFASSIQPVDFDVDCVSTVRRAAEKLDYPHMDIFSGAGHDACNISLFAPTGMIFVPCADGVSHAEEEAADPDDLAKGCDVLLHAVLETAGIAS